MSGLILPGFGLISSSSVVLAQTQKIDAPETVEEGGNIIFSIIKGLPSKMKEIWQNEVLPLWAKMGERASNWWHNSALPWLKNIFPTMKSWFNEAINWLSDIWKQKIKPFIQNILDKIKGFLGKEIEERKPELKQEFEKEKQEIKKEIPSIWQKIKQWLDRE